MDLENSLVLAKGEAEGVGWIGRLELMDADTEVFLKSDKWYSVLLKQEPKPREREPCADEGTFPSFLNLPRSEAHIWGCRLSLSGKGCPHLSPSFAQFSHLPAFQGKPMCPLIWPIHLRARALHGCGLFSCLFPSIIPTGTTRSGEPGYGASILWPNYFSLFLPLTDMTCSCSSFMGTPPLHTSLCSSPLPRG